MDNFERWFRLHAKMDDMSESVRKYFNHKYGVVKHAGIAPGDYQKLAIGLYVDYTNNTVTRLGKAAGLTAGTSFNKFRMFGGRRRCNVLDDGTITAYYGDSNFAEDGSNGQVMVYQPAFYYKVEPLETEDISTGLGKHLRKANYWISDKKLSGFKLHPAFYNENGNAVPYILMSAYEGSIFDTSAGAYIADDAQVMDVSEDKFCSIANVKPASGNPQALTRGNVEQLAKNRGTGWHCQTFKTVAMEQLLMLIELGTLDAQSAIGRGVVAIPNTPSGENNSSYTGSTSSLGNSTGMAAQTRSKRGDTIYTETEDGKTSISYRGLENFWGNIWKFVNGINVWGNGNLNGGRIYVCDDFNFADNKNSGNYKSTSIYAANQSGYISKFGYSAEYDYLFIPSECQGNANSGVKDYTYISSNLNGYKITISGGGWAVGSVGGSFTMDLADSTGFRSAAFGGRVIYVPV